MWSAAALALACSLHLAALAQDHRPNAPKVIVDTGAYRLLHGTPVCLPVKQIVSGTVNLEVTVNSQGEVTDARVVSGPQELRKSALQSVLEWQFAADRPLPSELPVIIRFEAAPDRVKVEPQRVEAPVASPAQKTVVAAPAALPAAAPVPVREPSASSVSGERFLVKALEFDGVPLREEQKLRERIPVRAGQLTTWDDVALAIVAVRDEDASLELGVTQKFDGSATVRIQPRRAPAFPIGDRGPVPSVR